jgi:hypothetical protein
MRPQRREEGQQLPPAQSPGNNHLAARIDSMDLKNMLRQINRNGRDR